MTALSRSEYDRRRRLAREVMERLGVDALVVQGASNLAGIGGSFRWFTGISASGSYPQTVIVPAAGALTLIAHGPAGDAQTLSGDDPAFPGIERRITVPIFPSVTYTAAYDATRVAAEIRRCGYARIGTLAPGTTYFAFGDALRRELAGVTVEDVSDAFDALRAAKSGEEIAAIRRTAEIQDEVFRDVCAFARPGMRDFEIMAYAQYRGALLGSETGYYLGSSAAPGAPALIRTRAQQDRRTAPGDTLYFQAETTGPNGYFTHLGRFIVFGKAGPALRDGFARAVEAQQFTADLLLRREEPRRLFAAYAAYLQAQGLPPETRLHCHGQGYDVVERPLLNDAETLPIGAAMNIGIHPSFFVDSQFITVCDNFVTLDGRVERLHQTPRIIFEL